MMLPARDARGGGAAMTTIPVTHVATGKVRDLYAAGDELLLVASDRISTYDVVHPTPSRTRAGSSPGCPRSGSPGSTV
jgi:hypothetical protein